METSTSHSFLEEQPRLADLLGRANGSAGATPATLLAGPLAVSAKSDWRLLAVWAALRAVESAGGTPGSVLSLLLARARRGRRPSDAVRGFVLAQRLRVRVALFEARRRGLAAAIARGGSEPALLELRPFAADAAALSAWRAQMFPLLGLVGRHARHALQAAAFAECRDADELSTLVWSELDRFTSGLDR